MMLTKGMTIFVLPRELRPTCGRTPGPRLQSRVVEVDYTGYSSGKIAQYLKSGKPVIVNDLPLLRELVEKYKCGIVVNTLRESRDALMAIANDYEDFSRNSLRAYEECFNPERYIGDIVERLSVKR